MEEAKRWLSETTAGAYSKVGNRKQSNQKTKSQIKAEIYLWTDGGSRNNGNKKGQHVKENDKAAWAFLFVQNEEKTSQSAGEYGATNNRMEIMALFEALKELEKEKLNMKSILAILDSKYVLDAIEKDWLGSWMRRGWKTATGSEVANKELWQAIFEQLKKFPHIKFSWTKGHLDNSGNLFVDELLNKTMDKM